MAYSIIYKKCTVYDYIKGPLSTLTESPFMDWYEKNNKKCVIFSYDTHGMEDSLHTSFFPDPDGNTGYIYRRCNDEYAYYDLYIRVLIDVEKKQLYFSDFMIDYENDFWGCEKQIVHGNHNAFTKLLKSDLKHEKNILNTIKNTFFGKEWYYHYRYTNKYKMRIEQERLECLNNITNYTELSGDIQEIIKSKAMPWPENVQTKISPHFLDNVKEVCKKYIGAKCPPPNDWGRYYAWGRVIGVFPEINYPWLL